MFKIFQKFFLNISKKLKNISKKIKNILNYFQKMYKKYLKKASMKIMTKNHCNGKKLIFLV